MERQTRDLVLTDAIAGVYVALTEECKRLLKTGAVGDDTPPKVILGVALENVRDSFIPPVLRKRADYKNLRCF